MKVLKTTPYGQDLTIFESFWRESEQKHRGEDSGMRTRLAALAHYFTRGEGNNRVIVTISLATITKSRVVISHIPTAGHGRANSETKGNDELGERNHNENGLGEDVNGLLCRFCKF